MVGLASDRRKPLNAQYETLGKPSVTLDDIKHFRRLDSKAPGHPEYHWVSGVEATTGPLGQGVANSVGMAIARQLLAGRYSKAGFDLFDYNIYAVCSDGCLMEGISSEAASLAGHLQLDNLCWIYDNNHITIEGNTEITFTEDVRARFLAYAWNVLHIADANDIDGIERALERFRQARGRPTLIILDSHIGYGSPTSRIQPRLTASRSARRRSNKRSELMDGRKMPVPSPRRRATTLRARHRCTRRTGTPAVAKAFASYREKYPAL